MFSDLKEAVKDADYVIEAIPEKIELKQKLFKQLDEYCKKILSFKCISCQVFKGLYRGIQRFRD